DLTRGRRQSAAALSNDSGRAGLRGPREGGEAPEVIRRKISCSSSGPVREGSGVVQCGSSARLSGDHRTRRARGSASDCSSEVETFAGSSTRWTAGEGWPHPSAGEVTRYSRQLNGRFGWMEQLSSSRNGQGIPRRK